jgi:uncharacterized protein (TIGR02246 family)
MQRAAFVVVFTVLGCSALYGQPAASEPREVVTQYVEAYNKGDARELGTLFTANALRMGSDGRVFAGRAEIEQDAAAALTGPRKGSKAAIRVGRTELLTPDVAVIEGAFEVTGLSSPVTGRYVMTTLRENGRWRIASLATAAPPASTNK